MSTILSLRTLRVYRVVSLVLAALIIGIPFLIPPDGVVDPLWMRILLGGIMASVTFSSLFVPYIKRNLLYFTHGFALFGCIWLIWLAFVNNLRLDYSPTVIVAILVGGVTFRDARLLWIFTSVLFIVSIACTPLATEPIFHPIYFLMVELVAMTGLSVLMASLIADREKIRLLEKRNRAVTVSAFEYSDTGILVTDMDGKILEVNPRFLEMMRLTNFKVEEQGAFMPLPSVIEMIDDPEGFLALTREGFENPDKHLYQKFNLNTGRFLERFSKPLIMDEKGIGRIWFYHDITSQELEKQRELRKRELLEAENAALTELAASTNNKEYNLSIAVRQIAQIGKDLLKVEEVSIWLASENSDDLQCVLEMGEDYVREQPDRSLKIAELISFIDMARSSRVLKVAKRADIEVVGELTDLLPLLKERPFLVVPIRPAGKLRGFILTRDENPVRVWEDEEVLFAASLGDIGGMIMESLQRRRSENALQESLSQNRSIVNAVPDLLLRMDLEGHLLDLKIPEGSGFHEFALTPAYSLSDLFPDVLAEKIMEKSRHTIAQQEITHLEYELDFENRLRDLEIRAAKSGNEEVLVMIRDVTSRKTTERELIQRNFELDSFVYRASHDLKAPLNSLMGLIDILKDQEQAPNILTYLKLMDRSVVKLDTFIHNLTEFSRINRLEIREEEVDLFTMVEDTIESLKYMDESENIRKEVNIPKDFRFLGDGFHLEIVVSNLISNALKYRDHKKENPFVTIGIEIEPEQLTIVVGDNGIGIPQKYQDRLFNLFFRASNQSFGSGLGLYILRNAVEKLKGSVSLKSEEGVGSQFRVGLPYKSIQEEN